MEQFREPALKQKAGRAGPAFVIICRRDQNRM